MHIAFDCCGFSADDLIFAGVVGIGTVKLYRVIAPDPAGHAFSFLRDCYLPVDFLNRISAVSSIVVSTHIGLVCEVSENLLLTFHIASGRFIRAIKSRALVRWAHIADEAQLLVAVGDDHIDVFTVNGTPVVSVPDIGPVLCCTLGTGEDPAIVIGTATGIVFWTLELELRSLCKEKVISFANSRHFLMFDHGTALFAADADGNARVFAVPRARRPLRREQVGGCAMCGRSQKLWACRLCGLLCCVACVAKQADAVCLECLSAVGEADEEP
jgi:hypothetical protein